MNDPAVGLAALCTVAVALGAGVAWAFAFRDEISGAVGGQADVLAVLLYPLACIDVLLMWSALPHLPPGTAVGVYACWIVRLAILVVLGRHLHRTVTRRRRERATHRTTRRPADDTVFLGPYTPADAERAVRQFYPYGDRFAVSLVDLPDRPDVWLADTHDTVQPKLFPDRVHVIDKASLRIARFEADTRTSDVTGADVARVVENARWT